MGIFDEADQHIRSKQKLAEEAAAWAEAEQLRPPSEWALELVAALKNRQVPLVTGYRIAEERHKVPLAQPKIAWSRDPHFTLRAAASYNQYTYHEVHEQEPCWMLKALIFDSEDRIEHSGFMLYEDGWVGKGNNGIIFHKMLLEAVTTQGEALYRYEDSPLDGSLTIVQGLPAPLEEFWRIRDSYLGPKRRRASRPQLWAEQQMKPLGVSIAIALTSGANRPWAVGPIEGGGPVRC